MDKRWMEVSLPFRHDGRALAASSPVAQHRACRNVRHYREIQAVASPAGSAAQSDPVVLLCALGAGRASDPGGLTRLTLWSRSLKTAMAMQTGQLSDPDRELQRVLGEIRCAAACREEGEGRCLDIVGQTAFREYLQCLERILTGQPVDVCALNGAL